MIIAIDFDGTIVEHAFPEIGRPINGAIQAMHNLQKKGHKLILWTCRNNDDPSLNGRRVLDEALKYCYHRGIEFDAINANVIGLGFNPLPKIYADLYIDDRAFPFVKPEIIWEMINKAIDTPGSILNQ